MNYSLKYAVDYAFGREGTRLWIAVTWFLIMAISTFVTDRLGEGIWLKNTGYCLSKRSVKNWWKPMKKKSYGFCTEKGNWEDLLNTNELVEDLSELFLTIAYSLPYCVFESLGFVLFIGFFVSWKLDLVLLLLIPFAYFFKVITERMRLVNREIVDAQAASRHFFYRYPGKAGFGEGKWVWRKDRCDLSEEEWGNLRFAEEPGKEKGRIFLGAIFAGKWDQTGRADIRRIAVSAGRDYARRDCGFNGNFFQLFSSFRISADSDV